jgi:hypothetical protein
MSDSTKSGVKIFNAHAKLGTPLLNAKKLSEFLRTPELLVRVGTVDEKAEPDDVRPTWYYFDSLNDRLYVGSFCLRASRYLFMIFGLVLLLRSNQKSIIRNII